MEWIADVSPADWLRERLDDAWRGTMHDVVPRGFAAYARVFHPASRDRPQGDAWPGLPYARHRADWDAFQARDPEIVTERVSWADTAAAMGTTMHAGAQWERLVAPGRVVEHEDGPRDAAGWRYGEPRQGDLEPDIVAAIAATLSPHTATPEDAYVGLWEGRGGLLGSVGDGPSRVFFQFDGVPVSPELARHNEVLGRSVKDRFNDVFRRPTWHDGILSREISEGPRLQLPQRGHVLFRGAVSELARPDWMLHVPWRDVIAEEHGFAPSAQSPSLVWPADHAWIVVAEVDFDSTIVGGAPEAIRALCADPRLEAMPVPEGISLQWDADGVNP